MGGGSATPGTIDHSQLTNRDLPNQHPIAAIEGLDETLGNTEEALDEIIAIQNEIIENGGSVPAGTTDHSALTNRDLPDAHPMSAITGLEEAIANLPTGGGGEWKHIRTVTIPEDITTDTSGVTFVQKEDGGATFAFDTDKDGKPFEVSEIFCAYNMSTSLTTGNNDVGQGGVVLNFSPPQWTGHENKRVNTPMPGRKTGSKVVGYFELKEIDSQYVAMGTHNVGNWYNSLTVAREVNTVRRSPWTTIGLILNQKETFGYEAGSSFAFYGR